jgi:hypothetical protein
MEGLDSSGEDTTDCLTSSVRLPIDLHDGVGGEALNDLVKTTRIAVCVVASYEVANAFPGDQLPHLHLHVSLHDALVSLE